MLSNVARAGEHDLGSPLDLFNGPINTASTVTGVGTTALYFGINHWKWHWNAEVAGIPQAGALVLTTVGCAAISPMLASALARRPLTYREAYVLAGSCVIPIVGGMIVNAIFDAYPPRDEIKAVPVRARYVRHYRHTRRHHRR